MSLIIQGSRMVQKYSTITGVVPTIPTSSDHTDGTWTGTTDIYEGEFFMNIADKKVFTRLNNTIIELGYSGQTGEFTSLADVPNTFAGSSLYSVRVNSGETALEFYSNPLVTGSTQLLDMPSTLTGYSGYVLSVGTGETFYELIPYANSFLDLTDVTTTGLTHGNIIVVSGTNLIDYDSSLVFVKLTKNQTIAGNKTFSNPMVVNSAITFNSSVIFNATGDNNRIDKVSTDSGFTSADDNSFSTSLAIKNYVDISILESAGVTGYTGNFVTTDTNQTITGDKTMESLYATLKQPMYFEGVVENTTINNISTDSGFTSSNDNELATSLAIKNYIESNIPTTITLTRLITRDEIMSGCTNPIVLLPTLTGTNCYEFGDVYVYTYITTPFDYLEQSAYTMYLSGLSSSFFQSVALGYYNSGVEVTGYSYYNATGFYKADVNSHYELIQNITCNFSDGSSEQNNPDIGNGEIYIKFKYKVVDASTLFS